MEKLISNVVKAQQTTELSCQHTMKLIYVLFRIFTQFFILAVDLECKKGGLLVFSELIPNIELPVVVDLAPVARLLTF